MVKIILGLLKRIKRLERWSHPPVVSPDELKAVKKRIYKIEKYLSTSDSAKKYFKQRHQK